LASSWFTNCHPTSVLFPGLWYTSLPSGTCPSGMPLDTCHLGACWHGPKTSHKCHKHSQTSETSFPQLSSIQNSQPQALSFSSAYQVMCWPNVVSAHLCNRGFLSEWSQNIKIWKIQNASHCVWFPELRWRAALLSQLIMGNMSDNLKFAL
jgi:hypothetical protein